MFPGSTSLSQEALTQEGPPACGETMEAASLMALWLSAQEYRTEGNCPEVAGMAGDIYSGPVPQDCLYEAPLGTPLVRDYLPGARSWLPTRVRQGTEGCLFSGGQR